ncbi:MAG: chromate transporter [Acidocella sp.]|nr:chromate transporter [Acidocella sp.]
MTLNLFRLFWHSALWSILSVGGMSVTLSDIFRYTVDDMHWITSAQFVAYFAISQALPGPNGMALILIGQKVAGLPGALVTLVSKLVPSSLMAYAGASWYESNQKTAYVKTAAAGLIPITVGLTLASSFVLTVAVDTKISRIILSVITAWVVYRYKSNPIWLILGAGVLGAISTATGINIF